MQVFEVIHCTLDRAYGNVHCVTLIIMQINNCN